MMAYQWNFGMLLNYQQLLFHGVLVTLAFTLGTILLGLAIGLVIGLARLSKVWLITAPLVLVVEIFRCTPPLVQLVWFYYAFPVLTGWQMSGFAAALLGLSLNTSAYCAEIFRGGIGSIVRGQWEAGRALGMTYRQLMRRIVLPQAVRRMLPAFTNRGIELGKMTAIASVIAVHELMYEARQLSSTTFRPLEVFTVIAVLYFLVIYPGTWLSYRLEARLGRRG